MLCVLKWFILIFFFSLAPGQLQSYNYLGTSEVTLKDMAKIDRHREIISPVILLHSLSYVDKVLTIVNINARNSDVTISGMFEWEHGLFFNSLVQKPKLVAKILATNLGLVPDYSNIILWVFNKFYL